MGFYSKESLEVLRQRVDLIEVLSLYLPMQRSGASYKTLCPFHEEKTPSFIVHKGDAHYHCFGCGAHGDAIAFLMSHLRMSFIEAIETLAERFQVPLEKTEEVVEKGPNKARLKQALEKACSFFHFLLLHSEEGHQALEYLYHRGISLDFIKQFQIGYAPKQGMMLKRLLHDDRFSEEELSLAGLIRLSPSNDFFVSRIMFPIRDRMGAVIGFSGRKFQEETFGGKYINTPETPLFKKSHTLFGFCYSRSKMAKGRKALIVEGQIDALRLIHMGFDYTVAGQGTAFGEGHMKELLQVGVHHVYLAFDGDKAGREAACKVGDLFQSRGVEVSVLSLPEGSDPDSFLRQKGGDAFSSLMETAQDYLTFLYRYLSAHCDLSSPSQKNEVVEAVLQKIQKWQSPVMVHESVRKLAAVAEVPLEMLRLGSKEPVRPEPQVKTKIDPDKILEFDLLRWMLLPSEFQDKVWALVEKNITPRHFKVSTCKHLFESCAKLHSLGEKKDWISLAHHLQNEEELHALDELMHKKINLQKAEEGVAETIRKMLVREWMEECEHIKVKIQDSTASEEEVFILAKQFDALKKRPPQIVIS